MTMFRALHDPHTTGATFDFTPKEKIYISGASGALTGAMLGLVLSGFPPHIHGAGLNV
jgi:hypothetical protein